MQITNLTLETDRLDELESFYGDDLGLPLERERESVTITLEQTVVEFSRNESETPSYHFAMAIPNNRFAEAKAWLDDRVSLLSEDGEPIERQVSFLNAEALYCLDPADNLLEFLAYRDLPTAVERSFDSSGFLYVSEVGMPVDDVADMVAGIRQRLGLALYAEGDGYASLGDNRGTLLLVNDGRQWSMGPTKASIHRLEVEMVGGQPGSYDVDGHPYRLHVV